MSQKARIITLQKKLSIAIKALNDVVGESSSFSWAIAQEALNEIERIDVVKGE